ncbi:hypothetical protein BST81_24490 [Leptolyngbya sp. 'hensonii']|uniref:PAS domain S-box protein n=1 Tax=Leptolyngbya sp. 'hensonii' TaxID=1922337 RepID=UPI00094FA91B|nr:PAS domain S-box protein [Leptolyngbya sp. 'hensonii']OLP15777.1 hypothetical protein BST81_24490 [Leptolyngbya sp. 'hensonii']
MCDRSSLTLLLIDDCAEDRSIYRRFLQQNRSYTYRIVECETAAAAIQWCQQEVPDVLLLAMNLPDGGGLEVLQQVRSHIPPTRMVVIMLTGEENIQAAVQAMKRGAQDYLSKSDLTPGILNQAIEDALHQRDHTQQLVAHQQQQQQLIATIALHIRQSLQLDKILTTTTEEVRQFLKTDRVLVYQFHPDMSGMVVAESVLPGWTVTLGAQVQDTYFQQEGAISYQQGRRQIVANILQAGLADCHVKFLQEFEVKAILVVPILVQDQLWGLLVAHHCTAPRQWQLEEVDLLEHLAVQIAIAIQQAIAYEQAKAELAERIQVEQTLRESEERFRSTFEQVAVGLAHVSPEGQFLRLNQRFCDITGYTPTELQSLTFQEITHPDDLLSDLSQMQRLLARTIQTYSTEKRYIRKNRSLIWVNLTKSLVRDRNGESKYFISVIEDITLRKQTEAERLQAEKVRQELKLLDSILDIILAGYWDGDLLNNQQYISPGFKRMFGYADHELENSPETWKQLVFPEDLPGALASFQRHVQSHGQVPYYNELRYRHKDGSTVWVMCTGRVIAWDPDGNPLRMIGCHIDITKRKQAEEALTAYANEIQDLYNNAPCGYHSLDADGRIININDTELQWLGYSREEVMGQSITRFMTNKSKQLFQATYPIFKAQGWVKDLEFDLIGQDGTLFPVLISATAVKSADGTYLHSRSTLFDVRDRKQAELQLRQMNQQLLQANLELAQATRMKDEFLANMSHELRTPLNAILGMSEGLQDGVFGSINERQRKVIATVERSGKHLLELINDILDLSKIESGKLELETNDVSIRNLCDMSLTFVQQMALKKGVQLSSQIPEDIGLIQADDRRLRQILINLLSNAIKFTPEGGTVTLKVSREQTQQMDVTHEVVVFSTVVRQTDVGLVE